MKNSETQPPNKFLISMHIDILEECITMTQFALNNGLQVEPSIMAAIEDFSQQSTTASVDLFSGQKLVAAHNQLSQLIAPATPNTLQAMQREYFGETRIPKPTLIQQLMILALIFLLVFVFTAQSEAINATTIVEDFTVLDHGDLLIYLMFLFSIAGLGASFSALFQANRYIKRRTFDPKQTSSYYIQILLGIIAGLFISQLVDFDTSGDTLNLLSKPTLALLGGFSSTVVYRILKQILSALESLVKSDSEEAVETQKQLLQVNAQQMIRESRLKFAAKLLPLKEAKPDNFQQTIDDMVSELLAGTTTNKLPVDNQTGD